MNNKKAAVILVKAEFYVKYVKSSTKHKLWNWLGMVGYGENVAIHNSEIHPITDSFMTDFGIIFSLIENG